MLYSQLPLDLPQPIVIASTPRSGSTELLRRLARDQMIPSWFNEPHLDPDQLQRFEIALRNQQAWILKFHYPDLYQARTHSSNSQFMDNYYILSLTRAQCRIRLRRRDLAQQAASLYLARITNRWSQHQPDLPTASCTVDHSFMQLICNEIHRYEQYFALSKFSWHYDLYYEDLDWDPAGAIQYPTSKPANYSLLVDLARQYL